MYEDAAVVALGSNLGGRFGRSEDALCAAVSALAEVACVIAASRIWRSASWPDPADPPFLNAVVIVRGLGPPAAALGQLHAIEDRLGRRRGAVNAPRVIDLDLVAIGEAVVRSADLVLPHPRAAERRFVMGPLAEVAPDLRLPGQDAAASVLARSAPIGADASPLPRAYGPFPMAPADGDCIWPAKTL